MTKTYWLRTIDHAVTLATKLHGHWFRGHAQMFGSLIPKVFRSRYFVPTGKIEFAGISPDEARALAFDPPLPDPVTDEHFHKWKPTVEQNLVEIFQRDAHTLSTAPLPGPEDPLGWLCWMQHYGAATRLLDWTENLLVALYFVVSESRSRDGELWVLRPRALNRRVGSSLDGVPSKNHPALLYLLWQPFKRNEDDILKALGLPEPVHQPIAFSPARLFSRMTAQQSVFTIHPPPSHHCDVRAVLTDSDDLVRYRIPATAKSQLLSDLERLGISHSRVFPDLAGLAQQVKRDASVLFYTSGDPIECGGPVDTADDVAE